MNSESSILLVEDDPSLGQCLGEFLIDSGHSVDRAGTLKAAREMLRTRSFGLCLLDLNLPDGSGLSLLKWLEEQSIQVPVIVITAMPLPHLRPERRSQALAGWLAKPVQPMQLLEMVRQAKKA